MTTGAEMDLGGHGWHADTWLGGEAMIVSTLRRCHAAYSSGDFDAAATVFHPDVELLPAGGQPPIRGIEDVRAWMEPDAFAEQVLEPVDVWVAGHKALLRIRARARGAASGMWLEFQVWSVWTFDAFGMAVRSEVYLAHQEAEARVAAGFVDGATPLHWRRVGEDLRPNGSNRL
jgi:ketosteroid isomerase-like protein